MPWLVRPAVLADVPEIRRVGVTADLRYRDVGHPELADGESISLAVAERGIAEGRLIVAEEGGRVIGWAYLERSSGELCLAQISVLTACGRRGVGTALLNHVIEAGRDAEERTIVLNTQRDVPWCMPWYERHGFVVVPRDEWTADMAALAELQTEAGLDWSTRVHMRRRLDGLADLVEGRVGQAEFVSQLDPAWMADTVRVWQVAPIRGEWTAALPVRAGQERAARELVEALLATVAGPGGGPPRNAIGLLERWSGRRGMRYDPGERARWPEAALYLEFMPAGADMVYAHYDLAYVIVERAAPLLVDARWYAILSQCEDVVDRWEIADGALRFERLRTTENRAREVLGLLDASIAGVRG